MESKEKKSAQEAPEQKVNQQEAPEVLDNEKDTPTEEAAAGDAGAPVVTKKDIKPLRGRRLVVSLVGIAILAYGLWKLVGVFRDYTATETCNDAQVEQYIAPVNLRASGYIAKVCFKEHQQVHKGDTLLILDDREYRIRLMEAEAALKDAKASGNVISASEQTTQTSATVYDASIDEIEVRLAKLAKDIERYRNLVANKAATPIQLEQLEAEYEATQKKLEATKKQQEAAYKGVNEVSTRRGSVAAAIQRADLSVAFSSFLDETAQACKLVLPLAEGLEREDCVAFPLGYPFSLFAIAQPASDPLFESRSAADVLMDIAKRLGSPFSFASVREFLAAGAAAVGASPDQVFAGKAFVSQAVVKASPCYDVPLISRDPVFNRNPGGLKLIPIWKNALGTPSSGLPPSNTVLTGEFLKEGLSVVSMNRASAVSLGLHEGSHVTIAAGGKTVRAVVSLSENIASNTAVAASGFGHEGFAGYNRGKGNNILTLIAACADSSPEFSADGGIDIQIRSKD